MFKVKRTHIRNYLVSKKFAQVDFYNFKSLKSRYKFLAHYISTFKLLGIHLDTNLSWSTHINSITSKASKRLYFLRQLKTAGVPYKQLLHFYTAVIRPVLEYAAPAWHHLINRTQAQHLESVQNGLSI